MASHVIPLYAYPEGNAILTPKHAGAVEVVQQANAVEVVGILFLLYAVEENSHFVILTMLTRVQIEQYKELQIITNIVKICQNTRFQCPQFGKCDNQWHLFFSHV